jgi:hypothetical protein
MKQYLGALAVAAGLSAFSADGQIIPTNRLPGGQGWFGVVGIPGGIPNRTTIFTNMAAGSSLSAVQNALNICPSNQVVMLASGSYSFANSLIVPTGVTLRGAGMGQSVINAGVNGLPVIQIGLAPSATIINTNISQAVSGGIASGATNFTVSNPANFVAGELVTLTELNDSTIPVTDAGDSGTCTWCDPWSGIRGLGQTVEVTSVNGSTVNFAPFAYTTYSNSLSPNATPFAEAARYAGVEDLTVYAASTNTGVNFYMGAAAYCWLYNVEGNFTGADHVEIVSGYRCQVDHSYFHDAFIHGPGTYDECLMLDWKSSGCLVEDNIFWRLHTSVIVNRGSSGNVIAYNYSTNSYLSGNTNFMTIDMDLCHGSHTAWNDAEGNVCGNLISDSIWGSSSHSTFLRNFCSGDGFYSYPPDVRYGASTATPLPAPTKLLIYPGRQVYAEVGIWPSDLASYFNIVGNIIGDSYVGSDSSTVYESTTAGLYSAIPYEILAGASTSGSTGTYTSHVTNTMILAGNWDAKKKVQTWPSGAQTISNSYYLGSKPAFFGNRNWPPFDPSNPSKCFDTNIPAAYRFFTGNDPTNSGTPPLTPSGLRILGL